MDVSINCSAKVLPESIRISNTYNNERAVSLGITYRFIDSSTSISIGHVIVLVVMQKYV